METEGDPRSSSSPNLISKRSLIDFRLIFQNVLFEELIKRGIGINDDRIASTNFDRLIDFQEFLKMIEMFILFIKIQHETIFEIGNLLKSSFFHVLLRSDFFFFFTGIFRFFYSPNWNESSWNYKEDCICKLWSDYDGRIHFINVLLRFVKI